MRFARVLVALGYFFERLSVKIVLAELGMIITGGNMILHVVL